MAAPPPVSDRQVEAFKRFILLLPHGKDVDLVILKAHLLLEEQVNALLEARLQNASALLAEERFESYYRIKLAQAFFPDGSHNWVWRALMQMNKLRNRVAHRIEPKGRDNLIKDIVSNIPGAGKPKSDTLQENFEFAMWLLHNAVSLLVEPPRGVPIELVHPKSAI
jgi:hypothetical protein